MSDLNLLAVSVGNTRTRIGAFLSGKLTETAAFPTDDSGPIGDAIDHALSPLRHDDRAMVLLASVNPAATGRVEGQIADHLARAEPLRVLRVERDVSIPIGRQLEPEAIVGEDRLLNAAAAYDVLKQACVIVDAGTALTVDFVDGAGTFHGGAITPGAQLMLDALHHRIPHLPGLEFNRHDGPPIGHNTSAAMLSGVTHGLRGVVRELVERYADHVGQYPVVIATGGDADLLFRDYELVDRIVPDLTLMGLHVTARRALSDDAPAANSE